MTMLSIRNLTKQYVQSVDAAVQDIAFELKDGEILALVGPSGCGKTTTLRLIAGLEHPDAGEIRINDRIMANGATFVPPERRGIGMVFQDHALFPHLTVYHNIAFGLRGKSRAETQAIVYEMVQLVGLGALVDRYPHALSGGERQRVALARALAPHPVLLLMDEPFSSLDTDLRIEMREQVRALLKSIHATVLFVTHDQEEALFMGDRLAVFRKGRIEQLGTPQEIFQASATRFVAEFMGNSRFMAGQVTAEGICTDIGMLCQPVDLPLAMPVEIAVRADDIAFHPDLAGNSIIVDCMYRGVMNVYRLKLDSGLVLEANAEHTRLLPVGTRVKTSLEPGHPLCIFPRP